MTTYLTEEEVERLLPMSEAITAVREAFGALARGEAVNQPRSRIRLPSAMLNVMSAGLLVAGPAGPGTRGDAGEGAGARGPAREGGASFAGGVMGVKVYSVSRGHDRFLFLLYGGDGVLLAVMEADRLGRIRTGAATGVATDLLARPEAVTVGMIGAGWQARSQLEAIAAVRSLRAVRVFCRRAEGRESFRREMEPQLGIEIVAAERAEEAVQGADIVVTITNAREPVLLGEWIAPGTHVNAAGANAARRCELDEEAVRRAGLVVVDSREQAVKESGDLIRAAEKGLLDWSQVPELADVVGGKVRGRTSAGEITLFKSNGIALEDVAVGVHVYRQALAERAGREMPMGG